MAIVRRKLAWCHTGDSRSPRAKMRWAAPKPQRLIRRFRKSPLAARYDFQRASYVDRARRFFKCEFLQIWLPRPFACVRIRTTDICPSEADASNTGTREPDSSASSITFDPSSSHEKRDWEAERRRDTALRFWRRPVVRQYFHKRLIWRAAEAEEVVSFELFVDLLYVGIIAIMGDNTSANPNGFGLLRFVVTFILGWEL